MHSKRTGLFALALLLTATVAVRGDNVDDYVKAEMQRQQIRGLSPSRWRLCTFPA